MCCEAHRHRNPYKRGIYLHFRLFRSETEPLRSALSDGETSMQVFLTLIEVLAFGSIAVIIVAIVALCLLAITLSRESKHRW